MSSAGLAKSPPEDEGGAEAQSPRDGNVPGYIEAALRDNGAAWDEPLAGDLNPSVRDTKRRRVHVVDESPEKQRKQAAAKEAYWKVSENLFPETNWHFNGGCTEQARKGEVYYCQACREAEREWLEIYPEWSPHKE
ncbi:MAG: hypothetical protein ABIS20_17115 [Thermoanaerobaculia bacterium]